VHLTQVSWGHPADDMGLGKTLQYIAWLAWLKERHGKDPNRRGDLPASVLHQLAARGKPLYTAPQGAGPGKRGGAAQSAQTDSAA